MFENVRVISRAVRAAVTVNPVDRVRRYYEMPVPEVQFRGRRTKYVNIGYWDGGVDNADDAGDALATRLAEAARFEPQHRVLDVGFGYGDQDFLWLAEGRIGHLDGLEITPRHVTGAQERAAAEGLAGRAEFRQGSGTELPYPDGTFDRVVSLDAALHFHTRRDFFREAMRVLRPGGVLATADTIPLDPATSRKEFKFEMFSFYRMSVPQENWYDRGTYAEELGAAGFTGVSVESIRRHTWEGWYRNRTGHADDPAYLAALPPNVARAYARKWGQRELIKRELDLLDSVIAVGTKPL